MTYSTAERRKTRARPGKAAGVPTKPPYDRTAQLPKLIGLWPHELADTSEAGTARVVALLRKALRGERQRGLAGHWTYDLNRHLALIEALREERDRLKIVAGLTAARSPAARCGTRRPRGEVLHLPRGEKTSGERPATRDTARSCMRGSPASFDGS